MFLGQGGVLNKDFNKPITKFYAVDQGRSSPQIKQEAPGTHLGAGAAGGLLNDGTVPIDNMDFLQNRNSISSPMVDMKTDKQVSKPFGNPQPDPKKYPGLKADVVPANGGIGISYSNLVLGNV